MVRQLVKDSPEPVRLGGVEAVVAHALEVLLPYEVRYVVLGHIQRGGTPTPFDRILATRFGVAAIQAVAAGVSGCMIAARENRITPIFGRHAKGGALMSQVFHGWRESAPHGG